MAVDLSDLVPSLKREVSPPGGNLYPNATGGDWLGHLSDAFWEARLMGLMVGFEENANARGGDASFGEGIITPLNAIVGYDEPNGFDPNSDLTQDYQFLCVIFAGYRITLTHFQNLSSTFKAVAGPVSIEQDMAASVLKGILDNLKDRMDHILYNLSIYGHANVVAFDSMIERTYSQAVYDTWYVR